MTQDDPHVGSREGAQSRPDASTPEDPVVRPTIGVNRAPEPHEGRKEPGTPSVGRRLLNRLRRSRGSY